MSLDAQQTDSRTVTSVDDLVARFREGENHGPKVIGLEHEKLIYPRLDGAAVPYEAGIEKVLTGFQAFGWVELRERPGLPVVAMTRGKAALTIEPGGQFELSGTAGTSAREAHRENLEHLEQLAAVLEPLGLRAVALGYRPFQRVADVPWMPKSRYRVMRTTLGERGGHAHHMMLMTATGQVSLDWADEADCVEMATLAARASPLLVALYANSPLVEGRPSGFQSFRSNVWTDVDPQRCGYPAALFDGSFSYRAYTEWALDAPLLFLRRRGGYLAPRITFRQLLREGFEGQPALYDDWVDHLSTLFPEVRLKRVIEIRSADSCNAAMTGALAALMRGLLYDRGARAELAQLLPPRTREQHLAVHQRAQREGLAAFVGQARDLVGIARRGLQRLDAEDAPLLDVLDERVALGVSPAEEVLAAPREPGALLERFRVA